MTAKPWLVEHTPGFLLTNVTLFSQHLVSGLEISASLYNLFDTHYGDPGAEEHRQDVIPQDGRSFSLQDNVWILTRATWVLRYLYTCSPIVVLVLVVLCTVGGSVAAVGTDEQRIVILTSSRAAAYEEALAGFQQSASPAWRARHL